jgi:hypothetical protein
MILLLLLLSLSLSLSLSLTHTHTHTHTKYLECPKSPSLYYYTRQINGFSTYFNRNRMVHIIQYTLEHRIWILIPFMMESGLKILSILCSNTHRSSLFVSCNNTKFFYLVYGLFGQSGVSLFFGNKFFKS